MLDGVLKNFFALIAIYSIHSSCSTISALRYGKDSASNDVAVEYRYKVGAFYLTFKSSFDYINSGFVMCFRQRPFTLSSSDVSSCYLTNSDGKYSCLNYQVNGTTISYQYYEMSSDKQTVSNIQKYTPSDVISGTNYGSYSICLSGILANKSSYQYISNLKSIYEALSNMNTTFYGSTTSKTNYLTSYAAYQNLTIPNLLMPRNFQCIIYNGVYVTGLFYGGVYRSSAPVLMFALVTLNFKTSPFAAWQGISFSKDHAYRDMIGVVLNSGSITDLYSLYATAPKDDTSTDVGGTNDVYLISSTGLTDRQAYSSVYITQFYRNYDTGDSAGDQVIMQKINNLFCLASYFTTDISSFKGTATSSSYQHLTYSCFTPDLALQQARIQLFFAVFLLVVIVLVN